MNSILDNVIIRYNNLTSKIIKRTAGIYELKNYLSLSYNNQYIIEILNLNITVMFSYGEHMIIKQAVCGIKLIVVIYI